MTSRLNPEWGAGSDERGGALLAVIAFTITVSALVGGILTLEAAQQRLFRREALRLQARYEAERCAALAVQDLSEGRERPFDVIEAQPASDGLPKRRIEGRALPYGLFALVDCTGTAARESHRMLTLVGEAPPEAYEAALVLADGEGGLTVADTATIDGSVFVGMSGMSQAVVARRPFRGTFSGTVTASREVRLPDFDANAAARALHTWLDYPGSGTSPYRLHRVPPVLTGEAMMEVGEEGPVVLAASGDLVMRGPLRLPPFTAILSPGSIRIEGDVALDNALIVAQDSIVTAALDGLAPHGPAQFIAGKTVTLGGASRLLYPSVVTATGEADTSRVVVADSARVDGFVFGAGASEVVLREMGLVRGALLAPGSAALRGSVHGSVLTRQLAAHYEGTYYVGWLIGGSIRAPLRPFPYAVPLGFGDQNHPVLLGQHTLARPQMARRR